MVMELVLQTIYILEMRQKREWHRETKASDLICALNSTHKAIFFLYSAVALNHSALLHMERIKVNSSL